MKKYVYMSLFSGNGYLYPLITLMYSWKNTQSQYPYYLLVTNNITQENKDIVRKMGYHIIEIEDWQPETYKQMRQQLQVNEDFFKWHGKNIEDDGWQHTFAKFKAFDLEEFDKILLLDCDILFLHNVDYLFEYSGLSSVSWQPNNFCSGCMLIEPNHELYQALKNFANHFNKDNQGLPYDDYMILRDFFGDITVNPSRIFSNMSFYDLFSCHISNPKKFYEWPRIDCLHMSGKEKPWFKGKETTKKWGEDWYFAAMWYNYYVDVLNLGINDLRIKHIADLKNIE